MNLDPIAVYKITSGSVNVYPLLCSAKNDRNNCPGVAFLRLQCGKIYAKQRLREADVFSCRSRDGSHVFSVNGAFNCQLTVTEPRLAARWTPLSPTTSPSATARCEFKVRSTFDLEIANHKTRSASGAVWRSPGNKAL